MSLQWELEFEVSWRPRQVVYIRIKADISALTYPNKGQPLCYPASPGGGAGGGDGGGRKSELREKREYKGLKMTGKRGGSPQSSHLSPSPAEEAPVSRGGEPQHEICCLVKVLDLDPVSDPKSLSCKSVESNPRLSVAPSLKG